MRVVSAAEVRDDRLCRHLLKEAKDALDRLSAKSMVRRIGEELRDIRFATVLSEEEHVSQAMLTRLGSSSDREAALLHFAGHLDVEDLQALRRAVEKDPRR